mgnify:CR=1 FL=1
MKYGFIGLGNMAGAIIAGMASCGKFKNDYLYGFNRGQGKALALKEKHGLIPCASAAEVAEKADVIVLCGKGHETYQITGDTRTHFDDKEEARKALGMALPGEDGEPSRQ